MNKTAGASSIPPTGWSASRRIWKTANTPIPLSAPAFANCGRRLVRRQTVRLEKAATASREFLCRAAHPVTGLTPEYANFDGAPMARTVEPAQHRFCRRRTAHRHELVGGLGVVACWTCGNQN